MRTLAPLAAGVLACALGVLALALAAASPKRALADKGNGERETTTAITGVTVVDPTTGERRIDQTILVERGRIATIAPTRELHVDPRARIVDAAGKWAIPGLVDAHVHFFQSGSPYTRPDIVDLRARFAYDEELARTRRRIFATLARWLASGVTAVADLGGGSWTFDVRAIARRTDAAPHVAVAGRIISTVDAEELDTGDPPIVRAKSPAHATVLAREQLARDPDFLKLWFVHEPDAELEAEADVVRAVADVAHAAGKRLVVHAAELDVATASLRAGADILAHSVEDRPVDETFLKLARERDAVYIPTLWVGQGYQVALSGAYAPTESERRLGDPDIVGELRGTGGLRAPARHSKEIARENLRRVSDAGITIAVGSDAGNIGTLHGPGYFREIEMLSQAGLSPREILLAATANGARVMGLSGTIGALEPGWTADVVVLDGDPLEDARNLARVHRVVRGGKVFDPDTLVPRSPEHGHDE
jgi:imidazolonepropionase-like amidohydrolase